MDTQMHLMAWHAANLMNVHLKRKVTVKKLLGKQKDMTSFDREAQLDKFRKAMAERRESSDAR